MRQTLLKNAAAFLLKIATKVYYKMRQLLLQNLTFYFKMRQLLQNATFITKYVSTFSNLTCTEDKQILVS